MPALTSSVLDPLISRNNISALATNASAPSFDVVCAWPVSGQYGPGSRVLYYVLVAACVFARKAEWLRSACLAAALIFPAIAAIHAIVLTSVHVDNAVDMDVFGAFQLCSIGILAAPVTVRHSRTYWFDPGRNLIFLWTGVLLAGLLSLTVEFFRITPVDCPFTDDGHHNTLASFSYGSNLTCLPQCYAGPGGPFSPMRQGSTDEIYIIPTPDKLSFSTALLLSAACCIPAVLHLAFMWNKILEINWKSRFGNPDEDNPDEPIEGTNGATPRHVENINSMVRLFLSTIEIPVFGGAVIAILILGELNFFSDQVTYQTESMASVGQWGPIAGTALAALGSLYLYFAHEQDRAEPNLEMTHCNCSHHRSIDGPGSLSQSQEGDIWSAGGQDSANQYIDHVTASPRLSTASQEGREVGSEMMQSQTHPVVAQRIAMDALERRQTLGAGSSRSSDRDTMSIMPPKRSWTGDFGNRRRVAGALTKVGNYLGNAAYDSFDDSEFQRGRASDFPEIPGEGSRNPMLSRIRETYNPRRDEDGNVTPAPRSRSRAGSFISVASGITSDGSPTREVATPTQQPQSPRTKLARGRNACSADPNSNELITTPTPKPNPYIINAPGREPDSPILRVPPPTHNSPPQAHIVPDPTDSTTTTAAEPSSPIIVISPDPDTISPVTEMNEDQSETPLPSFASQGPRVGGSPPPVT
ncbi:hypothetical protein F4778DRAFT_775049 [Xylariomycetidae sp. FL2044]|nr:hypothetical protein F4778DRAFT_775049 [Xylariomycetidae sp. FL2044]